MTSVFYLKKSFHNTLIINFINKPITKIVNNNQFSLLYNNDELLGINIFNVDLNFSEGFLRINDQIVNFVQQKTGVVLTKTNLIPFQVGFVELCENIPNTHLHKCLIDFKTHKTQIVCGAKNIKQGLKVVVANNNSTLPNGTIIKNGQLMNIDSNGMICSAKELFIKDKFNNEGIIELPETYEIGQEFLDLYTNN